MDVPLFSIIVPIYNKQEQLPVCVNTLLGQTYNGFEIILVNDGSTDKSKELCDQFAAQDSRVKVIHQPNAGVSEARNTGLHEARGEYISFVDPDDYVERRMYEILANAISKQPTDILKFYACKNGTIINPGHLKGTYEGDEMTEEVVLPMIGSKKFGGDFFMGVPWIHVFRRQLLEDNEIYFDKVLHRCEDRLFCITAMLFANNIHFVNESLYHYQVDSESLSNRYDPERWNQELHYLQMLREEYSKKLFPKQLAEANERIKSDYVFRAIISIDNAFFSINKTPFWQKYKFARSVVNNKEVQASMKGLEKEKLSLKREILFFCIKNKLSLGICLFNSVLLFKSKI